MHPLFPPSVERGRQRYGRPRPGFNVNHGAADRAGIGRRSLFLAAGAMTAVTLLRHLPARAASPVRILVLGDSLTAGYGLPDAESFPRQLGAALAEAGIDAEIINAGVSGDTTAGGRARLDWALAEPVDAAIVELGGNDGLRGIDPAETKENLDAILARFAREDIPVLLTGMLAPPNLGREYGEAFNAVFPALADKHDVRFYPFFLEGVAGDPALNQGDGIHPNAAGVEVVVEGLLPEVKRLVAEARE